MTLSVFLFELFELQPIQVARSCDHGKSCINWLLMGGDISQEWYEFSTGDHEIYRYGRFFDWISKMSMAVIEIIDR